jgi:hypothetical protein
VEKQKKFKQKSLRHQKENLLPFGKLMVHAAYSPDWLQWNPSEVDGKEYRLKLTTSEIVSLESKLRVNLLTIISSADDGSLPPLKVMLLITHGAMKKFQHGIKEDDVIELFDKYCEEGGTQMTFMTDVFLPIYQVSGFFSQAQAETMDKRLVEAKEQM